MTDDRAPTFPRDSIEFNRILNMSDGVAAIALTLLVLLLAVPAPPGDGAATADMGAVFDQLSTPLFAFTLSFAIIAFSWYGHHRFVAQLRGFDTAMLVWNFAFLFVLVLVPFASDLIGTYGNNPSATAIYAAMMASLYLVDLPGRMLARSRGLMTDEVSGRQWRARVVQILVTPTLFLLSIPVTLFVSGSLGYWVWFAIWPVIVVVGRRADRIDREETETAADAGPPVS